MTTSYSVDMPNFFQTSSLSAADMIGVSRAQTKRSERSAWCGFRGSLRGQGPPSGKIHLPAVRTKPSGQASTAKVGPSRFAVAVAFDADRRGAAGHVYRTEDMLEQIDGPQGVHSVLMGTRRTDVHHRNRPVGKLFSVDDDRGAHLGRFGKLPCDAADRSGRHAAYLGSLLGSEILEALLERLPARTAGNAFDLVGAVEGKVADSGIVEGLRLGCRGVPYHRLVRPFVPSRTARQDRQGRGHWSYA